MARATLIGFSAVAMWALLALLTDASGDAPPFLLSALTFAIGTCVGLAMRLISPPAQAVEGSVAGLADRHCRPVWLPLLLLHRAAQRAGRGGQPDRLSVAAVHRARLGADARRAAALESRRRRLLGLAGTVLIVTKGGGVSFDGRYVFGYAMAGVCAFVWSAYSLASRRFAEVPTTRRHVVLRGHLGAFAGLPFRAGRNRAAARRRTMARRRSASA